MERWRDGEMKRDRTRKIKRKRNETNDQRKGKYA